MKAAVRLVSAWSLGHPPVFFERARCQSMGREACEVYRVLVFVVVFCFLREACVIWGGWFGLLVGSFRDHSGFCEAACS